MVNKSRCFRLQLCASGFPEPELFWTLVRCSIAKLCPTGSYPMWVTIRAALQPMLKTDLNSESCPQIVWKPSDTSSTQSEVLEHAHQEKGSTTFHVSLPLMYKDFLRDMKYESIF